jgi:hypothetical protein
LVTHQNICCPQQARKKLNPPHVWRIKIQNYCVPVSNNLHIRYIDKNLKDMHSHFIVCPPSTSFTDLSCRPPFLKLSFEHRSKCRLQFPKHGSFQQIAIRHDNISENLRNNYTISARQRTKLHKTCPPYYTKSASLSSSKT